MRSGKAPLRSLLELCTAQRAIDPDSVFAMPALVERYAAKSTSDADRAMLMAFEAEIYADIYNNGKWRYNKVDAPLLPLPAEIANWSGQQFEYKIKELYAQAIALAKADNRPLADYKNALDFSDEATRYVTDIYGFIRLRMADNLYSFDRIDPGVKNLIQEICGTTVKGYPAGSDPAVFWECKKTYYVTNDSEKRFADYMQVYRANIGKPGAPYALQLALQNNYNTYTPGKDADIASRDSLIATVNEALKLYPNYYNKAVFINSLKSLTTPAVNVSVPTMAAPGDSITVTVCYAFASSVGAGLYVLPGEDTNFNGQKISQLMPCTGRKEQSITATDGTATFTFYVASPGTYAVVPTINGEVQPNTNIFRIIVAPLLPVAINGCTSNAVVAADYRTGAPYRGVDVNLVNRDNVVISNLGATNKNGILPFTYDNKDSWGYYLQFATGGRTYNFDKSINVSQFSAHKTKTSEYNICVLTDRNLYHPGDSISWVVVAIERSADGKVLAATEMELAVTLRDTNGNKIAADTLTTDAMGRVAGAFATVKNTLTGNYRLTAKAIDNNATGSRIVMVSDFKLPAIYAEITSVERNVPSEGCVRLIGKAMTYSGMPVANATVKATITGVERWRWYASNGQELTAIDIITDDNGIFSFDIPADKLRGTGYDCFMAKVTVTSPSAETAECERSFITGKPYALTGSIDSRFADSSKALKAKFEAYNADGKNEAIDLIYTICTPDSVAVLSGRALGGENVSIDISRLAAGEYNICLAAADTTLANSTMVSSIVLYNEKRNQVPDGFKLFVPNKKYVTDGQCVEILVGTSLPVAYVYTAVQTGNELTSLVMTKIKHGFARIKVALPANEENTTIKVFTVYQGRVYDNTVNVDRPEPKAPTIVAESFRDRLVPGAGETWRFRFVDGAGKGLGDAAMIATMYDKALDKLTGGSFDLYTTFYSPRAYMNLDRIMADMNNYSQRLKAESIATISYNWPLYKYWSQKALYSVDSNIMIRGSKYMAAASGASETVMAVRDDVVEAEVATEDSGSTQTDNFDYREPQVLQAFWKPMLVTDGEGNVDISFTVPNANTTWQFKAVAWSDDMDYASYMAEVMANKPVMVQPNLPRFLRQGDEATIMAAVFNNATDSTAIATTIEIFDIATNAVLYSRSYDNMLAAGRSATVSVEVTAPGDATALGYRVRSASANFADGEQAVIPVLEAATTVIESTEFYLNPGDKEPFTLTVDAKTDATLQYCQNPVWTVVKAMRGIAGKAMTTSTGIVSRLYSALAARYIVEKNPAIGDAIKQWSANPDEGALTSMLEKNSELKRLLLDQTPWVQAAASNSQRMAALAELLDSAKAAAAIAENVEALKKLRQADGGFAWGGWNKQSSEWATQTVLTTLGLARSMDMLSDSDSTIMAMLQPAYSYLENQALQPGRGTTDRTLTLVATLLPGMKKSGDGERLVRNTVANIASHWRKDNTVDKAYDVIMLAGNGRRTAAAAVLASIRQFGVAKAGMGVCFPSVDDIRGYATIIQAYKTMAAPADEIDKLRQWVVVQAQANDDLGARNPDYVIAAVLLTGTDWTSVPVAENVTANGKPLAISNIESSTGYFAQKLDTDKKLTIKIAPNGVTPSYGSVVTISRQPMASVAARPGRDIAIEKRTLVKRGDEWVATDSFALGERVRVQLTITAKRDMEYVAIDDERAACFEPVDQLPGYVWGGGLGFYRENLDASSRLFISRLPQGTYHLAYDMTAMVSGSFTGGTATIQSQYAPELTAHSGAEHISVK